MSNVRRHESHIMYRLLLNTLRLAALALSISLPLQGSAEEGLYPLSATTPSLVAVTEWHRATLSGNFPAFQKVTVPVPGLSASVQRQQFEELRKFVPDSIKISGPKTVPNGNIELTALGCRNGRRQVASVIIVQSASGWKVLSTGWSDVWGRNAKACPV